MRIVLYFSIRNCNVKNNLHNLHKYINEKYNEVLFIQDSFYTNI